MDLLKKTNKDIKTSSTISRYLSVNRKDFKIEILIDEVIYHLISEANKKTIFKIGTYTKNHNYIKRTDFDLRKELQYSDIELDIIFKNLA